MAQTTSLVFNGGVIPSPSPAPSGNGKAKLLKIGEITITEQGVQVTKKVICDPDSVTTVAPFMEVLTSARLAELVEANSVIVLDDGTMQYLMASANIVVEDETAVCTSVSFLGLSRENRAKVTYTCTRVTDELTLQQVIEVGEPVETDFNLVSADSEDTSAGTLIDKLEVVDNVRDPENPQDVPLLSLETTVDWQGNRKVAINEDNLRTFAGDISDAFYNIIDTLDSMDFDEVPHGSFGSSLNQSPGDGTNTSIQVSIFRPIETPVGDAISWTKTTEIGGEDFGTVTLEPGTYIICSDITCQWVGVPAGTYLPQVGNVLGEPFDFSQQQEVHRRMTNVVTVSATTQFKMRISFDAATPVMGFWINSAQIVKVAGGMSQTNVTHDSTLTGKGSVAEPLGVNVQNVAQATLADNVAPAFDPVKPNDAGGYAYYADALVMYGGAIYRFKVNHSSGSWNSSQVERYSAEDKFVFNQQKTESELDDIRESTINRFDSSKLMNAGWRYVGNGEYAGTMRQLVSFFTASNPFLSLNGCTDYIITFDVYTEANSVNSGSGIRFCFKKTNESVVNESVDNNRTSWIRYTFKSPVGNTDPFDSLYFSYGTGIDNIWHLKNITLLTNTTVSKGDIPYRTAHDCAARQGLTKTNSIVFMQSLLSKAMSGERLIIKLLGDSITAGYGGTGYNASADGGGDLLFWNSYENLEGHCWANSLKSYLQDKFSNVFVKNYGVTGAKSSDLINYFNTIVKSPDDIVIVMIGTNDRGQSNPRQFLYNNLVTLKSKLDDLGKPMIVMANIPASVNNETTGAEKLMHMEDVAQVVRAFAQDHSVPFVDVYDLFIEYCISTGTDIDSLLGDGLHPNDNGYSIMFELISKALGFSPKRPGATW